MKHKLFQLAAALEGMDADANLTTKIVITEGGDVATDGITPIDGSDPVESDPIEATPDADTPEDKVDPLNPEDTEVDGEVDPDAPIEYPDLGNLNVDNVDEKLKDDQEERDEAIKDASEEMQDLNATMEAMIESMRSHGHLTPAIASLAEKRLVRAKTRLEFKNTSSGFSLENFKGDTLKSESMLALEGFRDTISSIFEAIVRTIAAAFAFLRKMFREFLFGVKKSKEITKKRTEQLLKLRESKDYANAVKNNIDNQKHYVALPIYQRSLSINGVQPGSKNSEGAKITINKNGRESAWAVGVNYPEAMRSILEITQMHKAFADTFGNADEFSNKIDAITKYSLDFKPIEVTLPIIDYRKFTPNNYLETDKSTPDFKLDSEQTLYSSTEHLGDIRVFSICVNDQTSDDFLKATSEISRWKFRVDIKPGFSGDGWLRNLETDEIKETSKIVIEIEDALLDFEKTLDKLKSFESSLESISRNVRNHTASSPISAAIAASQEAAHRQVILDLVIGALTSIKENIAQPLKNLAESSHNVCGGWNAYLGAIYKKEYYLVNPNASTRDIVDTSAS